MQPKISGGAADSMQWLSRVSVYEDWDVAPRDNYPFVRLLWKLVFDPHGTATGAHEAISYR